MGKRKQFDLEKALKGHPLIDEIGRFVLHFRKRENPSDCPYEGTIEGFKFTFNKEGERCPKNKWLKLYLYESDFNSKEGDKTLVSHFGNKWVERIFLYRDKHQNFICVKGGDEYQYETNGFYGVEIFFYADEKTNDIQDSPLLQK